MAFEKTITHRRCPACNFMITDFCETAIIRNCNVRLLSGISKQGLISPHRSLRSTYVVKLLDYSWVLWIESVQLISINECILNTGYGFYNWQCETRHRQRKWWQDLLTGWNCQDVIFKRGIHWPYVHNFVYDLMSRLTYINSSHTGPSVSVKNKFTSWKYPLFICHISKTI
jgi:hypothetical protein